MPDSRNPGQDDQPDDQQEYKRELYGFPFMNEYRFGLCGGMSFGSCDYFNAQKPIRSPGTEQCDDMRDNLWWYFAQRQAASLRHPVFRKFFKCMIDNQYREDETNESFQFLKLNLRPQTPINLCLIRTDSILKAAENHQVLAYQLFQATDTLIEIHTYDPNEPRENGMKIYVVLENNRIIKQYQSIDYDPDNSPLLGFFVNERYSQERDLPGII